MPDSTLRVARDPALALVVRIFVGAVAERWGIPAQARDDLRLAASELFSGAVEAGDGGEVAFTLSSRATGVTLRADGLDPVDTRSADPQAWGGRFDLIRALFPDAEVGGSVHIHVPGDG
jgi:anti-sigma regulatory factor (Ser/Thr protein kinase)